MSDYLQSVGNAVLTEQQTAAQAATRQAQQSVQLTDYTYIYETQGVGVVAFTAMFDVTFSQEPVMHHGMSLPDFATQVAQAAKADDGGSSSRMSTLATGDVLTGDSAGNATYVAGMDSTAYPLVSAYVKRWLTDSTGLYVGAEMILVIGVLSLPAAVEPEEPPTVPEIPSAS